MEIVRFLRSKKYDTVICTFPEDRFVLWSLGAGAKQRVGQKQQRMGWMLNVRPDIHKEIGGVLNYYCDLAEAAGGKVDSSETEYRVPDSGREWADRFLTTHNLKGKPRLVVLHPGASAPHRMWPPDRCAAVIEILRSDGRTAVVLCGSEADSTVVGEVKRHLRTEIPVAEPGGSIPNFAGLLQACMLCICNDSGPRHQPLRLELPPLPLPRGSTRLRGRFMPMTCALEPWREGMNARHARLGSVGTSFRRGQNSGRFASG
jgi:ADP-heptose:LPS heptosyltransferase